MVKSALFVIAVIVDAMPAFGLRIAKILASIIIFATFVIILKPIVTMVNEHVIANS